jgi:hypothetical protein
MLILHLLCCVSSLTTPYRKHRSIHTTLSTPLTMSPCRECLPGTSKKGRRRLNITPDQRQRIIAKRECGCTFPGLEEGFDETGNAIYDGRGDDDGRWPSGRVFVTNIVLRLMILFLLLFLLKHRVRMENRRIEQTLKALTQMLPQRKTCIHFCAHLLYLSAPVKTLLYRNPHSGPKIKYAELVQRLGSMPPTALLQSYINL